MQFELWEVTETLGVTLPDRWLGYLLLLFYILLTLRLIYSYRAGFRRLSLKQWGITSLLALASLLTAPLFLLISSAQPQLTATTGPVAVTAILGSVPFLLAAATLNPAAAFIVGFSSGLGRAFAHTHQIFEPFHFALAAVLAAGWLRQNYLGRLYGILRRPLVAGLLANLIIVPLIGLATFVDTAATDLVAFDLALSAVSIHWMPFAVTGIVAGVVVTVVVRGLPHWRSQGPLVPSPQSQQLSSHLRRDFALFGTTLLVALTVLLFALTIYLSRQIVGRQITSEGNRIASQIPLYRNYRQNLLLQHSSDEGLRSDDPLLNREALGQLFSNGELFERILLVDAEGEVRAFFPPGPDQLLLTGLERTAADATLSSGAPGISPVQEGRNGAHTISFVVPVLDDRDQPVAVLVGRVPDIALDSLISGVQDNVGTMTGFILDENEIVIAHPDKANLGKRWPLSAAGQRIIETEVTTGGSITERRSPETGARELAFSRTVLGEDPWTVVMVAPYEAVLALALQISLPVTFLLIVAVGVMVVRLSMLGDQISRPVRHLLEASQSIAGGSLDTPIDTEGADEIGQLSRSFDTMQRSLKRRLDELQLLVDVSQQISASLNINDGIPVILQGAVRGTGASGARAVLLNQHGRLPLTFSEGPAGDEMGQFDRLIMGQLRRQRELILSSPAAVQATLGTSSAAENDGRLKTLLAIGLYNHDRFQGIFWLAYRHSHQFDPIELNLVRTLAGQAAVLAENARLFTSASSGRRRLAAVLSSTTDAVIVTDQTERVLLINPAMERAFKLKTSETIGRAVSDVIHDEKLLEALTSSDKRVRNLEITTATGRTLHANASPISSDGQAMGRVAVLHDITRLKEIDEMKSEFVATVSHDLRGPLSFMHGYMTMLPMVGELNDKQQAYVQKVMSGISQMSDLITDLLDLGRIEAGVELDLSEVQVTKLLNYIATDHTQPAQTSGIELVIDAQPNLPVVQGDTNLIRQAITNLVGNAIKYAPNSGRLLLKAEQVNGEVVVSVHDHGPGIAEQDLVRIFDQFYRIKRRETVGIKGSGLGLAIVRSIAERHGGRAWCQSELGAGSTFFVTFPLQPPAKEKG